MTTIIRSEQCPFCHEMFYALAGYDPLKHHFEYCPNYVPEDVE